jgi:hypothetical protein
MFKKLLFLAFLLIGSPALAQNVTCATRPAGDSSNACASTAFASTGITNLLGSNNTWTGANTWGTSIINQPRGEFIDNTTIIGSLQRFFNPEFYGVSTIGKVHLMNRLFVGAATLSSGGIDASGTIPPVPWIDQYVRRAVSIAQFASGSSMGMIGITGYSRTSDYFTWSGLRSLGSEAGVFVGVNDDAGGIAVGLDARAVSAAKAAGIATNQIDAVNLRPTFQTLRPYAALNTVSAGLIYPFLLTTGVSGSTTHTVTISIPGGVITDVANGLFNDDTITFSTTGALPTGLTAGTVYYVVNVATNSYQVSATPGGAAINTSGSQSGVQTAKSNVAQEVTAFAYMAGGVGAGLPATAIAQKGIVMLDGSVDKTYGLSTGGVFAELPGFAAIQWMKPDGTGSIGLWGDPVGNILVSSSPFYSGGNVTAMTNLIGRNIISGSAVPTLSSCGTSPAVNANSTNIGGNFTTGTGSPTSCTLTFANAYPTAAACVPFPANAAALGVTASISPPAAGAFTVTFSSGVSSASYNYVCLGK